jgi:hypothetical protein
MECARVSGIRSTDEHEVDEFATWYDFRNMGHGLYFVGSEAPLVFFTLAQCPECGDATLVHAMATPDITDRVEKANDIGVDFNSRIRVIGQWPKLSADISKDVPSEIRDVLAELDEDFRRGRNTGRILAGCRSVLDVALTKLGQTQGSRGQRIAALGQAGLLTTGLTEWAAQLWRDGNEGVHELKGSGHPVAEHIAFLKLFVEVAFVLPKKIQAGKHKRRKQS